MGCLCGLAVWIIKYILFFVNFLVMLSGIAIIVIGVLAQKNFSEYEDLFEGIFSGTAIAIIVVGSIICVVGFCGCCGAITEKRGLLITYGVLMIFIFLAEVAIGIVALTQVETTKTFISDELTNFFYKDFTGDQSSKVFDAMQYEFQCCGVNSPTDYLRIFPNTSVPLSCCSKTVLETIQVCNQVTSYRTGCLKFFSDFISDNVKIVGAVTLAMAAIELLAIIFSFCLAYRYRK